MLKDWIWGVVKDSLLDKELLTDAKNEIIKYAAAKAAETETPIDDHGVAVADKVLTYLIDTFVPEN